MVFSLLVSSFCTCMCLAVVVVVVMFFPTYLFTGCIQLDGRTLVPFVTPASLCDYSFF